MVLIGLVTLSATQSLWWALVPLMSGWAVWLATSWVLATFDMKLSLSGGPLVAQIIVLTMPAASHLAIHYPRRTATRSPMPELLPGPPCEPVTSPILWCAADWRDRLRGSGDEHAWFRSSQFGWIMALCTLLASLLVMAISPAAMLPPFRMDLPTRSRARPRSSARGMEVG